MGIVAGTKPDLRIILCPCSAATHEMNPDPKPTNVSLEIRYTSLINGYDLS